MHLIAPLVNGFSDAPIGVAQIFQRGTNTRATWYEDFEGASPNSSGNDIPLSSSGRAIVYVNQLVRVVVKTAAGVTVQTFTAGAAATCDEYQGASFTGNDYVTAAAAAGEPTTVAAILDLVVTKFGTIDWDITAGGFTRSPAAWMSSLAKLVYNAKDAAYGAAGSGSVDDSVAINAAITAANAAGGGYVLMPQGTYRLDTALTLLQNVSLIGVGYGTLLRVNNLNYGISVSGYTSAARRQHVANFRMDVQAPSVPSTLIYIDDTDARIEMSNVELDHTASLIVTNAKRFSARGCIFTGETDDNGTDSTYTDCIFVPVAAGNGLEIENGAVTNCLFDFSAITTSNTIGIDVGAASSNVRITGCHFTSPSSGTCYGISIYGSAGANYRLTESANTFGTTLVWYLQTATPAKGAIVSLGSRVGRRLETTIDSTPVSLDFLQYEVNVIKRTSSANQTVNIATPGPDGAIGTIIVWNESGGNITSEDLSSINGAGAGVTVNNNNSIALSVRFAITESAAVGSFAFGAVLATGDPV